jgi:prevent-host-death family protein
MCRGAVMTEYIGSYEAKTKLPEILRRVEAGENFTITNHGKAIADVIPSRSSDRSRVLNAIANILKAKKRKVSDELLEQLRMEGKK